MFEIAEKMFEIVAEIVKSGHAEELNAIVEQYENDVTKARVGFLNRLNAFVEQYEIDVSKRKENEKNDRL